MVSKTNFLMGFLFGITAICPAFAATTATQDWVKKNYYSKTAVNTLNNNFIRVRDSVLHYDSDPNSPTHGEIINSLNTTGQNAFDGINEVLQKVDGNNGTEGTAVALETDAQNAFGAINELKGRVDNVYTKTEIDNAGYLTANDVSGKANANDVYTKTEIDNAGYLTANDLAAKANASDVYSKTDADSMFATKTELGNIEVETYTAAQNGGLAIDEDNQIALDIENPVNNAMYVYKNGGWSALDVNGTFPDDFNFAEE